MKQFFKYTFASMLGMLLGIILFFVVVVAILVAIVSSAGTEKVSIKDESVLHIKLQNPVSDRASANPFENLSLTNIQVNKELGLNDILKALEHAKENDKIKGIFLDVSAPAVGIAALEEIRNSLLNFKKSGKFIWSYSEGYSQAAYYLSSLSDSIFLRMPHIV